jgi:phage tail sheath protein FI
LGGGKDGEVLQPKDGINGNGDFETALNISGTLTNGALYGIRLLDQVNIFNLLCVPGEADEATISSLEDYCTPNSGGGISPRAYGAFFIADCPQIATVAKLGNGPIGAAGSRLSGGNNDHAAYYFPWVQAPDPLANNRPRLFPPSGFVAGIYASTDANRGVWKAPAGVDASLSGVTGLQYVITDMQNGTLSPQAINCLRQFPVYGDVVWGARTLQGNDTAASQWKYIPIRRMALFLEASLYDGTQWVAFEPNDETLWEQIRLNVGAFMQGLFRQGAFQGTAPQQAYFVKCDSENNPQSSIDVGIVNILVGFAPLYPAEFVVIQIQQMAGQC